MNYFLPDNYVSRPGAPQFLDAAEDAWQDEVYREAAMLYREHSLCTVLDYGTGSGFKLVKYFGGYCILDMCGVDRAEQVAVNRQRYPTWFWTTPERYETLRPIDLVICADVIEHVDYPNILMTKLWSLQPKWLVISTPDRNLLPEKFRMGPPHNPQHVREWDFVGFERFVGKFFDVVHHFHSNVRQATQCIVARP